MVPTTKLIKIKNHPLYPKCVSLFFVGPIFCNLASLGDNFQKLNIINFLYWFWTFKMMEHHRKFNFQNYLSKYFSKNWFCIPSSNFTRLALDCPLHAPFHFTHLTFWSEGDQIWEKHVKKSSKFKCTFYVKSCHFKTLFTHYVTSLVDKIKTK